jgi:ribosomal protein L7/L12
MGTSIFILAAIVFAFAAAFVLARASLRRARESAGVAAPPAPDLSGLDDEAFRERVLAEIEAGRKIEAIKLVRERTRLSLADAKALVEALASGEASVELELARRSPGQQQDDVAAGIDAALVDDPGLAAELVVEIAAGRRIEAIRLLRERTGLGLKEAKDAIEALERGG